MTRPGLALRRAWAAALLATLVACDGPARKDVRFEVTSAFGAESEWTADYLTKAARVLVRMMDAPDVVPPALIRVTLEKDPALGGIGGWATPAAIGFKSNVWPEEQNRRWILAHELTNLLVAHYAGAGAFPSDWWADGRSPFPEYASCLVMAQLGFVEDAAWRKGVDREKRDHVLYWDLHKRFGFDLFAGFLRLVRADGIDMGKIGKPWPTADKTRSACTIAYLSIAAGENLAATVREHGIGRKPPDWDERHPERPFEEYEVTAKDVDALVAARKRLFVTLAGDKKAEPDRERFRRGDAAAK